MRPRKENPFSATAVTPQGLIVGLDGDGRWSEVQLARGPVKPEEYLAFGPALGKSVVSPRISNVLMRNQLVWVVSQLDQLDGFKSTIDVGDFKFDLGVIDEKAPQPVLIFKFSTTRSFADLIEAPELWAEAPSWVGKDPAQVQAVQNTLRDTLAAAQATFGKKVDPFVYFRNTIALDPEWTGILAVNTPINGNSMPPDLQMLFAGIDGQLTAHHFGIEANQLDGSRPTALERKSSFFGVIRYVGSTTSKEEDPSAPKPVPGCGQQKCDPAYAFEVCYLTVVFANSIVADFHCQVAMTVDELFGREVSLEGSPPPAEAGSGPKKTGCGGAPNTILMTGRYQRHGPVGTVTFDTRTPFVFEPVTNDGQLIRVIESVALSNVSLAPVTQANGGSQRESAGDDVVRASFGMAGTLRFVEQPFPAPEPPATDDVDVDLFGYGSETGGLDFTNLTLDICFQLSTEGRRDSATCITFDAAHLRVRSPGSYH